MTYFHIRSYTVQLHETKCWTMDATVSINTIKQNVKTTVHPACIPQNATNSSDMHNHVLSTRQATSFFCEAQCSSSEHHILPFLMTNDVLSMQTQRAAIWNDVISIGCHNKVDGLIRCCTRPRWFMNRPKADEPVEWNYADTEDRVTQTRSEKYFDRITLQL